MRSIFSLLRCQKNLILLFSRHKALWKTRKNTREFHFYCWDHVCNVYLPYKHDSKNINGIHVCCEWCLVDFFYREFRVSIKIMVRDFYIAKCKTFFACDGLLMAFRAMFFYNSKYLR